jgi:hypothetical protein
MRATPAHAFLGPPVPSAALPKGRPAAEGLGQTIKLLPTRERRAS